MEQPEITTSLVDMVETDWADTCEACGAHYTNVQHPMKPAGVIIMRTCDCRLEVETQDGMTIVRLVPPKKTL